MDDLLKLLGNRSNQGILNLLHVEPSYPRKIAALLGLTETEVARRLKKMENLGLLTSEWSYIGKNVKLYKLSAKSVKITVGSQGMQVQVTTNEETTTNTMYAPFDSSIPVVEQFYGRTEELAAINNGGPAVSVQGLPGIGKSGLMATWAKQQSEPVFWHAFRGVESLNWFLNRAAVFLNTHGEERLLELIQRNGEIADKSQLLLNILETKPFIWMLDDVHKLEDDNLRAFLGDSVRCIKSGRLILGSRIKHAYDHLGTTCIEMDGLDEASVAKMLQDAGHEPTPDRLLAIKRTGGHPLALHLLLTAAQNKPIDDLLRGQDGHIEDYLLREVYSQLEDSEKSLMASCSVYRMTFDIDEIRALLPKAHKATILKLQRKFLVMERGQAYAQHDLIKDFFYEMLDDKKGTHLRAAKHCLSLGTIDGRIEAMWHYMQCNEKGLVVKLLEENLDVRDFDLVSSGYTKLYLKLLKLLETEDLTPRQLALVEDEKGDVYFNRGDYDMALEHYNNAFDHFHHDNAGEEDEDLAWKRAMCMDKLGQRPAAVAVLEDALPNAPEEGIARKRLEELLGELK